MQRDYRLGNTVRWMAGPGELWSHLSSKDGLCGKIIVAVEHCELPRNPVVVEGHELRLVRAGEKANARLFPDRLVFGPEQEQKMAVEEWDRDVLEKLSAKKAKFFHDHPEFLDVNIDLPYSIDELAACSRQIELFIERSKGDPQLTDALEKSRIEYEKRGDPISVNWDGSPRDRTKDPLSHVTKDDLRFVGPPVT